MLVLMNVFFLISYSRQRAEGLFHDYLLSQGLSTAMGTAEQHFLFTFHQSLVWAGMVCAIIALLSSYVLARSITISLRQLSATVKDFEDGNLDGKVTVTSRDEIGELASAFNRVTTALAVNQRLRKRLLADIAHELNTPLTVIEGNLEGMLCGLVSKDEEQLQSLHEEAEHLSKLISDLKDLSLAEAGQLELERWPVDMNLFFSRMVQMLRPLADEKGLQLIYDDPGPLPPILADNKRIHQVFQNLLTNAFRYTPAGGVISISLYEIGQENNRWLQIDIKDTGLGIAEDDLPYIFERFYRTSRSRDRKSGGSGLGLAIVKEIVEIHNGRVMVKSQQGSGSTFTVYLPVDETA